MAVGDSGNQIDTVMHESAGVSAARGVRGPARRIKSMDEYQQLWDEAAADPPAFWAELARDELHWFKPFTKALEWNEPFAEWFVGGKTNASYNCLDRTSRRGPRRPHRASSGKANRATRARSPTPSCTAKSASSPTCSSRWASSKGDVVSIYMPMMPELAIAMLACARIGAIHSVIFAGFSAEAIADRNNDAQGQAANHRRRRLAARQGAAAQANRRRSAGQVADASKSASCSTA